MAKTAEFEIRKSESAWPIRYYWFVLKAPNGKIILDSEMYKTKQGAKSGIASIKKYAADAPIVEA